MTDHDDAPALPSQLSFNAGGVPTMPHGTQPQHRSYLVWVASRCNWMPVRDALKFGLVKSPSPLQSGRPPSEGVNRAWEDAHLQQLVNERKTPCASL